MKWTRRMVFTDDQRKETAKMLLGICEVIILAIVAGPYIAPVAKKLTFWDNVYGFTFSAFLYLVSMRRLRGGKIICYRAKLL